MEFKARCLFQFFKVSLMQPVLKILFFMFVKVEHTQSALFFKCCFNNNMVCAPVFDGQLTFWIKIAMLATDFCCYGTAFSLAVPTEAFRFECISRLNLFKWFFCNTEICWQPMEFEDGIVSGLDVVSTFLAHWEMLLWSVSSQIPLTIIKINSAN